MSDQRFLARSAVFVAVLNGAGDVLLQRRANTGYMDGWYDLPSGHVEQDEPVLAAAVRELKEEANIDAKEADLQLWHVNQFSANGQYYYNFFFIAKHWQGTPQIMETEKCDDMGFFALGALPRLTAGSKVALDTLLEKPVTFGYIDQMLYDEISAQ